MNAELRIDGLVILLLIYIGVILYLVFGKKIPLPKTMLFSKSRKKAFIAADLFLFIIYIASFSLLLDYVTNFNEFIFLITFSFLTILHLVHFFEQYFTNKEKKADYHTCADFFFTAGFVFIYVWTM